MRELIPIKKDIIFKSRVAEIITIDVEHDFKINDDMVDGKLMLSGTYKMTEASLIEEDFYYEIPFSIAISSEIVKESINLEISDFKYSMEKDVIKINAELEFTCDKEEYMEEEYVKNESLENYFMNDEISKDVEINEEVKNINTDDTVNNLTNTFLNTDEKYNTYKVYIVREGDTIDTICAKYNVKYEDIKDYNNLTEINIGDKIIIPFINE